MGKAITWIAVLAVVVIGGLAIYNGPGTGGAETIKLGVIQPFTGDAASYGESELRGIEVAVAEINEAGGIDGKLLELVTEDGKCDPQAGGAAAQKLVNVDRVKVIIGGACSGETLAAANVTEPAEVLLISPSATSPDVTDAGDFLFRTIPSDALAGETAAAYAFNELGAETAAVLAERTDYAQGLREVFMNSFGALGGEIIADETYATGDTDFRTQILKIKDAEPDVMYLVPQTVTPGVAMVAQVKEHKVGADLLTAEVLLDREAVAENVQTLEGVIGVEVAIDFVDNVKAAAFREAHLTMFDAEPGMFSANAYDAVYLIRDAIAQNGLDTIQMRDWLYGVANWPGTVGFITFDEHGDLQMSLNVRKIVGGEVTDLGPYEL
jgi:branched-chain amino acid transport system substrate-binding protein